MRARQSTKADFAECRRTRDGRLRDELVERYVSDGDVMPVARSRHRDVGASGVRAAVLGAGDGLLTNVSLVLGVAGANPPASTMRLAGLAGLLAGAFSMAAGELVLGHQLLSPQEMQIARLVADGLSNREIGERLFLSHRTVGSHLYRIFPKLGVTSRAQLAMQIESTSGSFG